MDKLIITYTHVIRYQVFVSLNVVNLIVLFRCWSYCLPSDYWEREQDCLGDAGFIPLASYEIRT